MAWNDYRQGYEFTKIGKIPVGELSLMLFNQIQEPLILEKLAAFELSARRAFLESAPDLPDRLTDLRLYRAQLKRILSCALYFLEIQADGATLHKIGVTRRPIEERTKEVERELLSHFKTVAIDVRGVWPHRGNVELYFKHRYECFNHPIGSLSEYYKFDDPEDVKAALRDLRRMKPKVLCQDEKDILEAKPSLAELAIAAEQKALLARAAIRVGMERAASLGVHIGRPTVAESDEEFLSKPSSQRIVEALKRGLSLRQASRQAGVSVNTVRKVKAVLQGESNQLSQQ